MFISQPPLKEFQYITPPLGFVGAPLTPLPTNKKAFTQAPQIIVFFKDTTIKIYRHPFSLHNKTERRLKQDKSLFRFVKNKIQYIAFSREEVLANNASQIDITIIAGGIDLLFTYLLSYTKVERF